MLKPRNKLIKPDDSHVNFTQIHTMNSLAGKVISSTEQLKGTSFEGATIIIAEHNDDGALGFIINQQSGRRLNELTEFASGPPVPLFIGGPVDQEHLYFIHQRHDLIEDSILISDNYYLGGNFKQAIEHINNQRLSTGEIKIFLGYCGWNSGELEAEIEEGSWMFKS